MLHKLFRSLCDRQMRPGLWAGTWIVSALIVATTIYFAVEAREDAFRQAEEKADVMATYLSQHAKDTFEIAELALASVGRLIGSGDLTQRQVEKVHLDMLELLRKTPRLDKLAFYEQSGWLMTSSDETANSVTTNISRSPVFERHQGRVDTSLHISRPYRIKEAGPWLLDLSEAIYSETDDFAGVLIATMRVQYFADFYANFDGGENARVNLLGKDGQLLARNPYDETMIGMDLSSSDVFRQVQMSRSSGHSRVVSPVDGIERLASFQRVPSQPLTVVFSVTKEASLESWKQYLVVRIALAGIMVAAIFAGMSRLSRYAEGKRASEADLVELSRTDALTGVLNRRAYDHLISIEWLKCVSSAKPLTLMMIDVDNFKSFNDTYGHQQGDACLQSIARSLQQAVHDGDDCVLRYGGEEFAVVLPDTSSDQAPVIAQRLLAAVSELAVPHVGSSAGVVTVSVGYATEDRRSRARGSAAQLVADADRALYAAKVDGRNRTVCGDAVRPNADRPAGPRLVYGG